LTEIPPLKGNVLLHVWSLSDEALLAGMGSGDPEAAAGFVRRYQARVYGLALMILGDRASAEEVSQETFLKAWRHAHAFDARRGHVSTWLLTITRNAAIDAARTRRADPLDPETLLALSERRDTESDDPFVITSEIHRLREAIRGLPMEQKVALIHAAFYGRTAQEISQLEKVPLGTVKTRIRTAMLKLRAALEVDR
jgi:RNA polymerase sigma factor (sigma-70 family)